MVAVLSIAVGISVGIGAGKIINKLICKPYYDKERNKEIKNFMDDLFK